MKNIFALSILSACALLMFTACGGGKLPEFDEKASERQIEATASLVDFLKKNPEVAQASLRDVRTSGGGRSSLTAPEGLERSAFSASEYALSSSEAGKAVELIDKVIETADPKAIIGSVIRVGAVMMHITDADSFGESNGTTRAGGAKGDEDFGDDDFGDDEEKSESDGKGKGKKGSKKPAAGSAKSLGLQMVSDTHAKDHKRPNEEAPKGGYGKEERGPKSKMSCEEIIENPGKFINEISDGEVSESDFEDMLDKAEGKFKKTVSNCPHMKTEKFAKCMQNVAKIVASINRNVKCSITKMKDLEKAMGKSKRAMELAVRTCGAAFKKCGYNPMAFDRDESAMGDDESHDMGASAGKGKGAKKEGEQPKKSDSKGKGGAKGKGVAAGKKHG